jgi:NAD(P)-dependent dehydrogenase (short-subunit alcohol dehydrogenase family)
MTGAGLLAGQVAVVSGIGPGLGREIALALAREGADVVLGGRTERRLAKVAAAVTDAHAVRAVPVVCDVTDEAACVALADRAVAELGGIDILVNNAFDTGDDSTVLEADLEAWQATMDVNFYGAVRMTRAVSAHLEARGGGSVVMINTMSTERIRPRFGVYAASKSALRSISRTLAQELGPAGIRVNSVHPGYIWGPSVEWFFQHEAERRGISPEEVYREVADETCLGYLPPAAEIADAVLFFASPLARAVTGQSLGVNAGHWLH